MSDARVWRPVCSNNIAVAGVLVVNITWRGKTYVGTLLDCARHTNQWSAPRYHRSSLYCRKLGLFCDSNLN